MSENTDKFFNVTLVKQSDYFHSGDGKDTEVVDGRGWNDTHSVAINASFERYDSALNKDTTHTNYTVIK